MKQLCCLLNLTHCILHMGRVDGRRLGRTCEHEHLLHKVLRVAPHVLVAHHHARHTYVVEAVDVLLPLLAQVLGEGHRPLDVVQVLARRVLGVLFLEQALVRVHRVAHQHEDDVCRFLQYRGHKLQGLVGLDQHRGAASAFDNPPALLRLRRRRMGLIGRHEVYSAALWSKRVGAWVESKPHASARHLRHHPSAPLPQLAQMQRPRLRECREVHLQKLFGGLWNSQLELFYWYMLGRTSVLVFLVLQQPSCTA
mmetsp:Transcript_7533/g.14221  ORF Transcript_7533/g.14221 Transcript_7533/m.14221 type:complete len:253 (+) Transcript_7533:1034-1792(+)